MTGRIEKTVFISYRRKNSGWALAIYQHLTSQGYDVFFDYTGIASEDFEQIILENIKARAHFLILLTPDTLDRCNEPGDWLRREFETALDTKRNIVPLLLEGFDYKSPKVNNKLSGKLALLKNYNSLSVPTPYFAEAMVRLVQKYLRVDLDIVMHPISKPPDQSRDFEIEMLKTVSRPLRVFLCHASQDKPTVRELYKLLINWGVDVWLDEEKILPGQQWDLEIQKAIRMADSIIVCLSQNSVLKEGYIQKELRSVIEISQEKPQGTIFIIPTRLDSCEVPEHLRIWQYVDFFPNDQKEWAFQRLQSSLRQRAESLKL